MTVISTEYYTKMVEIGKVVDDHPLRWLEHVLHLPDYRLATRTKFSAIGVG